MHDSCMAKGPVLVVEINSPTLSSYFPIKIMYAKRERKLFFPLAKVTLASAAATTAATTATSAAAAAAAAPDYFKLSLSFEQLRRRIY